MGTFDFYGRGQSTDQGDKSLGIPATGGIGPCQQIVTPVTAGAGGSADDVTVYASTLPNKFVITDVKFYTTTAISMSTVTLRTATAGGGTALTNAISSGSTGAAVSAFTAGLLATLTVASATSLYLRRSDNGVAGTLVISVVPSQ